MAEIMNINQKLPEDIFKVIFSKLPSFNLPNCRIVCRTWNNLIVDHVYHSEFRPNALFISTFDIVFNPRSRSLSLRNRKVHFIDFDVTSSVPELRFTVDWPHISVVSSCNGLLYVYDYDLRSFGILNPMSNEFIQIPGAHEYHNFGFGFCSRTNKYKLFRISYDDNDDYESEEDDDEDNGKLFCSIQACRFGISPEWASSPWFQPFRVYNHGVYSDGFIYWIGYEIGNDFVIYALDVDDQTFETVAILDVGPSSPGMHAQIQQFNDTIYVVITMPKPIWKVQVWVMRDKFNHTWIREFVVDLPKDGSIHVRPFEDEGHISFLVNNDLFGFDKTEERKVKIKTLFNPNQTKIVNVFHVQPPLYFSISSLRNILAGYA